MPPPRAGDHGERVRRKDVPRILGPPPPHPRRDPPGGRLAPGGRPGERGPEPERGALHPDRDARSGQDHHGAGAGAADAAAVPGPRRPRDREGGYADYQVCGGERLAGVPRPRGRPPHRNPPGREGGGGDRVRGGHHRDGRLPRAPAPGRPPGAHGGAHAAGHRRYRGIPHFRPLAPRAPRGPPRGVGAPGAALQRVLHPRVLHRHHRRGHCTRIAVRAGGPCGALREDAPPRGQRRHVPHPQGPAEGRARHSADRGGRGRAGDARRPPF
mmetsp:Transcript_10942/g.26572  ORF Transcript_10942/g.26572 Transcript_10942/m.26572 type:complete len:270 (+) Transcript_10942:2363-3172(+)